MENEIKFEREWHDSYPTMTNNTPFARQFNKLMGDYWVRTGQIADFQRIIQHILVEDYNTRNE